MPQDGRTGLPQGVHDGPREESIEGFPKLGQLLDLPSPVVQAVIAACMQELEERGWESG